MTSKQQNVNVTLSLDVTDLLEQLSSILGEHLPALATEAQSLKKAVVAERESVKEVKAQYAPKPVPRKVGETAPVTLPTIEEHPTGGFDDIYTQEQLDALVDRIVDDEDVDAEEELNEIGKEFDLDADDFDTWSDFIDAILDEQNREHAKSEARSASYDDEEEEDEEDVDDTGDDDEDDEDLYDEDLYDEEDEADEDYDSMDNATLRALVEERGIEIPGERVTRRKMLEALKG